MKKQLMTWVLAMTAMAAGAAESVTGMWTTIDDSTGKAKSVVQIYEYKGKVYGRVVKTMRPNAVAKLPGNPKTEGLDIIWDLEKDDDSWTDGKVLDPENGKVYGCEIWREGKNLIVRGKIAFLGRNQTWLPNTTEKPLKNPVPKKPVK